jgi:hypothetical protein
LGAPHCGILTEILVDTLRCHPKRLENTENPWDMWQAEKVWKRSGYFSHSKHSGNNRKKKYCEFWQLILWPDFGTECAGFPYFLLRFKRRSKRGVMHHMLDISWVPWDSSCENLRKPAVSNWYQLVLPRSNENHHGHPNWVWGPCVFFLGPLLRLS